MTPEITNKGNKTTTPATVPTVKSSRPLSPNPYIAAAQVAGNFVKKNKKPIAITTVGLVLFFGGKKGIKEIRKRLAERDAGTNINTQQAMQLHDAIKQWGGSSKDIILNMAKQGMDIDKVAKKYKRLYGKSLYEDLRKKLNADQYAQFMSSVHANPKPITDQPATRESYIDASIKLKKVLIKNSTKAFYNPAKYPFGYIKTVSKNSILNGVATGSILEFRSRFGIPIQKWAVVLIAGENYYHTIFLKYEDLDFIDQLPSVFNFEKFTDSQFENLRYEKFVSSKKRKHK